MLQGDYCDYEKEGTPQNATSHQCEGLSSRTLSNLAKSHVIGILVVIIALSFSQWVGRKHSAIICYSAASLALLSQAWCQGRDTLIFKISAANSLVRGSVAIMALFIQEVYPTSIRGVSGGFFFSAGHLVSTLAPCLTVYVVVGHEVACFVMGGIIVAVCAGLLCAVKQEVKDAPLRETVQDSD